MGQMEDQITNLPDCITSNILSRLVTKEAMRTSVLSRDWKHKWTSIYDVDIAIGSDYNVKFPSFYSFVDRVLDSNPDLKLRIFRLDLGNGRHESYHLERWISKVLGRGVEELRIRAPTTQCKIILERPTSLTRLKLYLRCSLIIRIENCFPSLKHLYLHGSYVEPIKITNEQSPNTGELSLTFPVLQELDLHNIKFADVSSYNSWEEHLASRASLLLQGFPGLKCLKLSRGILKAIAEWKGFKGFPTFDRLKRLRLYDPAPNGVMELLQATPNLESLVLDICYFVPNLLQEPLPRCIVSSLKRVHLRNFYGERFQFYLANLFLKKAKKLKGVYLHPLWGSMKDGEINSWKQEFGPESASRVIVVHK